MSIRLRLVAALCASLAAAFALLAWILAGDLSLRFQQAAEEALVDTATAIAAMVAATAVPAPPASSASAPLPAQGPARLIPDVALLRRALASAESAPLRARIWNLDKRSFDIGISLTDAAGIVLLDTKRPQDVGRDNSAWNDVYLTMRGQYGARATWADPGDPRSAVLHVAAPVRRTDVAGHSVLIGVLTVSKAVDAYTPFEAIARERLVFACLLVAGIAAALAVLATLWVTRPLARLAAWARAGKPSVPPPTSGPREIAQLARAFAELVRTAEGRAAIEQHLQAITHALKTPLAGIRASAELLADDLPASERVRFLGHLRGESQRLAELVDALLVLARIERRGTPRDAESLDLAIVAEHAVAACQAQAATAGVRIDLVVPSLPCQVVGERFLLDLCLRNLLDNAIAFSPHGGCIEIRIAAVPADTDHALRLRIAIADRGPGLDALALERAGERFFTTSRPLRTGADLRTGTGTGKGTGLGLAIVREVAALHRGSFRISNRAGGGACAEFDLPAS